MRKVFATVLQVIGRRRPLLLNSLEESPMTDIREGMAAAHSLSIVRRGIRIPSWMSPAIPRCDRPGRSS